MDKKRVRQLRSFWQIDDPAMLIASIGVLVFLLLFILYPLAILLTDSVIVEKKLTLSVFARVLKMHSFRKAITNTLCLGTFTSLASVCIGFLFAYVHCYIQIKIKAIRYLFKVVSILPIVSPPFVLSLSAIMLFGRTGIISRGWFNISSTRLYGLPGIMLVQVLSFFPVCYLMIIAILDNIDTSLEEASCNMGASRFQVFKTVTLPLLLPGVGNAFLITFIESVADFANPMIIGGNFDTLATSIYLQLTGAYDKSGATVMAVVLLCISVGLFLIEKYYLDTKSVATRTGRPSHSRVLISQKNIQYPLVALCAIVAAFVLLMYALVPLGSIFKQWGRDFNVTLKWYVAIFKNHGYRAFIDSGKLSLLASPITALLAIFIAYLTTRSKVYGKGAIEFITLLAMAVPGTVLGVGFIRGFTGGVFHSGLLRSLYGSSAILVLVFIVRSLPIGARTGIATLKQIDKSIEEAAYDAGASTFTVFFTVILPMLKDAFFSGLVTTFVRSITAISAVILLVTPRCVLLTVRINEYAEKGSYSMACAYATVLIIVSYGAILLMELLLNKASNKNAIKIRHQLVAYK